MRDVPIANQAFYKRALVQHFDARANYGQGTPQSPLVDRLLEIYPPSIGDRVLDVATGTGFVAFLVARLVGPSGEVIATDISPGMLERAQEAAARNVVQANLSFICADAEHLPQGLGTFDRIYCANALPYLTDIPRTLRQWRMLLKSGGQLAFNCWRAPSYATGRLLREVAGKYGINVAEVGTATGTPEACRALLNSAGYGDIEIAVESTHRYIRTEHLEDFIDMAIHNPIYDTHSKDMPKLQALLDHYLETLYSCESKEDLAAEKGAYFVSAKNNGSQQCL